MESPSIAIRQMACKPHCGSDDEKGGVESGGRYEREHHWQNAVNGEVKPEDIGGQVLR
jgi:hypothetical protein